MVDAEKLNKGRQKKTGVLGGIGSNVLPIKTAFKIKIISDGKPLEPY